MPSRAVWCLSFVALLSAAPGMVPVASAQVSKAWMACYDGPGTGGDVSSAIAVDSLANIIVVGSSSPGDGLGSRCTTAKYDPDGNLLWMASYGGSFAQTQARAVAVDANGNALVTGTGGIRAEGPSDYVTLKYSPDGEELWARRYNGPGDRDDVPAAIAVDANGNVYVTGFSSGNDETTVDYATVKYSPDGTELWVRRYDGPGHSADVATAMAADAAGNVCITGKSYGVESRMDYATLKYTADGEELWVRRYDGAAGGEDVAIAIALDAAGNVYVVGGSDERTAGSDYVTVKYSPAGTELWVRRFDGPGGRDDWPRAIALDAAGNILVTGNATTVLADSSTWDYATVKYSPDGSELWVALYDGPDANSGLDSPRGMAVDAAGDVHVTGVSFNGGADRNDYATVKYSADGEELWVHRYNGPGSGDDSPWGIALDSGGNVLITGQSGDVNGNIDSATLKLDAGGHLVWTRMYAGPGSQEEAAVALGLDAGGSVLVTGVSEASATGPDFATVKYSSEGNRLWVQRYDGGVGQIDTPSALAVDSEGNVLVTGASLGNRGTGLDYATVKYASDGTELWVQLYNGPGSRNDRPGGLAVDSADNVLVTGESVGDSSARVDFATVKYDPDGTELWVRRTNGPNNEPLRPRGIAVGESDHVVVVGEFEGGDGTDSDYLTVKYAPDGTELWSRRFNGPESLADVPVGIAVDASGGVLVTGMSLSSDASRGDVATVKYAPDGTELWARRYNGPNGGADRPAGIAVDAAGNVHVAGSSRGAAGGTEFATIKYDRDGNELWVRHYGTQGTWVPKAIILDGAANVLVAGGMASVGSHAILKYDPSGKLLWTRLQPASIVAIAVAPDGGVHATGGLSGDYATVKYESIPFRRGFIVASDKVEITDAIVLLQYLFLGGVEPACLDAADVDDSGEIEITDPIRLLGYLFLGGPAPAEPFSRCGRDITADSLECGVSEICSPSHGLPSMVFYGQEFRTDGVFYVVDASSSMSDTGDLALAKDELVRAVGELPEAVEFGMVFFNAGIARFPSSGVPAKADAETKLGATTFVQSVEGATWSCSLQGLLAGLEFANQSKARRKVLIYVSDGGGTCSSTSEEAIYLRRTLLEVTAANTQGVEIHCMSVVVPSTIGREFMQNLAWANGGTYTQTVK